MDWSSLAIVVATLCGPVLAVQAQKWIERQNESQARKVDVFRRLMATRSARLSAEHVQALNLIELTFYGKPNGTAAPTRSEEDEGVILAWREYFRHLNVDQSGFTDQRKTEWGGRADELFLNLLEKLAIATRYRFDREQLRSAQYSPMAHFQQELEQQAARRLLLEVLAGTRPIAIRAANQQEPPPAG